VGEEPEEELREELRAELGEEARGWPTEEPQEKRPRHPCRLC